MDAIRAAMTGIDVVRVATATGASVATFAVLMGVRHVVRARVEGSPDRAPEAQRLIADLAGSARPTLLLVLAVYVGASTFGLPARFEGLTRVALNVMLLLQGGIWANHAITFATDRYRTARIDVDSASVTTMTAIGMLVRLAVWAVLLLLALDNVGIKVTAIVAGLGIGGIAVALAAQNILGDLFSSLSIVLDQPFVVGDFIIVGSEMGTVEHVGLKTTRVRSLSGEQLIFANTDILQSRIRNYRRMDERRVVFTLGVTYQATADQLEAIPGWLRSIVEGEESTRFDRAHFARYADSALEFEVVYYVLSAEYNRYMDIQQRINLAVYRRFAEAGVEFAYPTRTLHVVRADGA